MARDEENTGQTPRDEHSRDGNESLEDAFGSPGTEEFEIGFGPVSLDPNRPSESEFSDQADADAMDSEVDGAENDEIPDLGPDGLPLFGEPPPHIGEGHDELRRPQPAEMPSIAIDRAELDSAWQFICDLPGVNRTLLLSGTALIVFAILSAVVPPAARGVGETMHAYTPSGRQEACQSRMSQLATAFALYRQDSEDMFPPMEYKSGTRVTWANLIRERTSEEILLCPASGTDTNGQSSYGYNSALTSRSGKSASAAELASPSETLLLADRDKVHDLALLPPFAGWQILTPNLKPGEEKTLNIAFPHSGRAVFLYADGHAAASGHDESLQNARLWGGAVALRQGRERLLSSNPLLQRLADLQPEGDGPAVQLMKGSRKDMGESLRWAFDLWQQNDRAGADGSKEVEEWGWRLARLWNMSGKGEMLEELNRAQSWRSQAEVDAVQKAEWVKHTSDWGFSVNHPNTWEVKTESSGRYRNTTFTSGSPHINVLVEKGERDSPGPESGIDWTGLEANFKSTHGDRYWRFRMEPAVLAGEAASLWEFEIEKRGQPKLRKLYIGRSHRWDSYVLVMTAPSQDFGKLRSLFEQFSSGLSY